MLSYSNSEGVYCVGVFNGQESKIKHKSRSLKRREKSQNNNEKQTAIGSDEQQV